MMNFNVTTLSTESISLLKAVENLLTRSSIGPVLASTSATKIKNYNKMNNLFQ